MPEIDKESKQFMLKIYKQILQYDVSEYRRNKFKIQSVIYGIINTFDNLERYRLYKHHIISTHVTPKLQEIIDELAQLYNTKTEKQHETEVAMIKPSEGLLDLSALWVDYEWKWIDFFIKE